MRRSIRKAVAFVTFLALALEMFIVTPDVTPANAAEKETKFYVNEWGSLTSVENPTSSVTIKDDYGADDINLSLFETGIKSLTIEKGYRAISLYGGNEVEELVLPKGVESLYLSEFSNLKKLVIPNGVTYVSLYSIGVEKIDVPASVSDFEVSWSEKLKKVDIKEGLRSYMQYSCPNLKNVNIPSSVSWLDCDDYTNITVSPDNIHYEIYEGSLYKDEVLIKAADKKKLNIKDGTVSIGPWALCSAYAVTTISIPDSVKMIEYGGFAGATNVKELKLPKGLLCIYSAAFDGIAAPSIEIPSSVEYIDWNAFEGYKGTVTLQNNESKVLEIDDGAIYAKDYEVLLSYPKNRTELKMNKKCITIAYSAINGCDFKTLDIPEGVAYFYVNLSDCKKLTSINIPSTMVYINSENIAYNTPMSLAKFTVANNNQNYSSYEGCLYSKNQQYLYNVPKAKDKVNIARGCVTIDYYAFAYRSEYDPENDYYVDRKVDVTFPGTITDVLDSLYYVRSAKVECGTTIARILQKHNEEADMYGWSDRIEYEFVESDKNILKKIVVSDDIQIQKTDKNQYATYTVPSGLSVVKAFTALHEGTNTNVKVTFTSSNKSVCKVGKTTGKLTPVKKGTATIKVKCQLPNGSKKTYKTIVTVK
ncbi:MAG: leucine-rich repeat protein [Lachnospiraceae bacterium]|nr:leucine-rich repeat protein [Lachnospiraceae bacterium]